MLARDVMTADVVTASPSATVSELVETMFTKGISGLPVVDEDGHVLGVVTETDLIARAGVERPRRRLLSAVDELLLGQRNRWWSKAHGMTAGQLMSAPAHTASAYEPVRQLAARLIRLGIKRMPVVDGDGRCVGIVSQRDLMRLLHRSDEEIAGEITAMLADPTRSPEHHGASATVEDGVVTLTGWAQYPMDVDLILAMVRDVPGVLDVQHSLVAREPNPKVTEHDPRL